MPARFHYPESFPVADSFPLPPALAHHAVRVLRLADGAPVVLFNGEGGEVHAHLVLRGREAWVEDVRHVACERESPLDITLVQALAGGDKMDWIVQKAVELGVRAIQPLTAARSVVRLDGARADKRLAHWQQIAVAACEQCGRNRVPMVLPLRSLDAYLAQDDGHTRWALLPQAELRLADCTLSPDAAHALLVGPEGGWAPEEEARLAAAGVTGVRCGPRILRTETAGLAALAVVQSLWGDF